MLPPYIVYIKNKKCQIRFLKMKNGTTLLAIVAGKVEKNNIVHLNLICPVYFICDTIDLSDLVDSNNISDSDTIDSPPDGEFDYSDDDSFPKTGFITRFEPFMKMAINLEFLIPENDVVCFAVPAIIIAEEYYDYVLNEFETTAIYLINANNEQNPIPKKKNKKQIASVDTKPNLSTEKNNLTKQDDVG